MPRALLYVAVVCALAASPRAQALEPRESLGSFGHQTWQTETGLPQNSVHAIAQSADGYLWLGTDGGLARFDGYSFTVFDSHNTPALQSNQVRHLLAASDGSLWAATAAGAVRLQGGRFTRFTSEQGLPGDNVWSFYETRPGNLWCVTAEGLAAFDGKRFKSYPSAGTEELTGAIAAGENASLLVGTHRGVRVFRNGRFARSAVEATLSDVGPDAILVDHSGQLYIGTRKGLLTVSELGTRSYTERDGLPSRAVTTLFADRESAVWVGTDAGLARMSNGRVERFPAGSALAASTILCIFEDREHNLWVGTDAGLTILREQAFLTYGMREGVAGELVRAVMVSNDSAVWMATENGLSRRQDGSIRTLTTADGLASNITLALAQNANGDVLVGTPDGLNRIHGKSISLLTSADGLADDFVRSIYVDGDQSLWVSTRRGLTHVQGNRATIYTHKDGLGADFVGAVLRDNKDRLWVATLDGLSRFDQDRFRNYTTADGLSSNVITALYADNNGALWVGTQGGGLDQVLGDQISAIPERSGLPVAIYGIVEDSDSHLWFSSNTGIFRVSKNELNHATENGATPLDVTSFGTSDGLRISECTQGGHPAVWKARDGGLWFATLKGAAVVHPDGPALHQAVPLVVVESVSMDDRTFDPASIREIKPGYSRFAFEYAGLSFSAPGRVKYRYKLEGFDKDWIDAGARRIAYYTNLSPGRYRFLVTARNGDSGWNRSGAGLSFRLQPRFYQTYWFYLLAACIAGVAAYGIYRWRVREVESRFAAVLNERNRIAREIHDTLAQGFVGVSVQLEVVARLVRASPEEASEHLNQARSLVRESIAEARRAIWELRSQTSSENDFAARVSKIAKQAAAPARVQVELDVKGTYRPLTPVVEDELTKICQEAVTNAIRHAQPKTVRVELSFERRRVRMTIADDGCGFDTQSYSSGVNGHFGLQGMRERAKRIDAQLVVESQTGKGTRVSVETMVV